MTRDHANAAVSPLVRAVLRVRDLQRAAAFYLALGLDRIQFEGPLEGSAVAALLGVHHDARSQCLILKTTAQPNFGMIGLLQIDEPNARPSTPTADPHFRPGEVALVFFVADLDATLTAALLVGGTRVSGPLTLTTADGTQSEALLRDPDGVLINLIERPPVDAFAFSTGS